MSVVNNFKLNFHFLYYVECGLEIHARVDLRRKCSAHTHYISNVVYTRGYLVLQSRRTFITDFLSLCILVGAGFLA